ncbi:MAG: hypothetical protein R3Y24_16780 [Eubacteriales bacterium]
MNYDKIIVEMLSRIQVLEEEVQVLKQEKLAIPDEEPVEKLSAKVTTNDICEFINCLKEDTLESSITLVANHIHRELDLKSRMPLVCNAMKRCMLPGDEILFETASGYSSRLEIKYYLKEWDKSMIRRDEMELLWMKIVGEFKNNPRNIQTQPTDARTPKWFYVGTDCDKVYVESGRDTVNNSIIKGRRYLEKDKLETMLDLYKRRLCREKVSAIATGITQNQVYWYGILAELGI